MTADLAFRLVMQQVLTEGGAQWGIQKVLSAGGEAPAPLLALSAVKEQLGGVLALLLAAHGEGSAHAPAILLKGLNNGQEEGRLAQGVAVVLRKLQLPVVGGANKRELRGLLAGAGGGGGDRGELALQAAEGLLADGRADGGDDRGVEGAGNAEVRHVDEEGGLKWELNG